MAGDTLLALIAGTLGVNLSEINDDSQMATTRKWDSLRQILLMTELETHFGLSLADEEMLETTSVMKIRALLTRHGKA